MCVIDSYMVGEFICIVVDGGFDFGNDFFVEWVVWFEVDYFDFCVFVVFEFCGYEVIIGVLLVLLDDLVCEIGVIYFNNL